MHLPILGDFILRTVLKEDLNIRPRKPHYVRELTRWLGRRGPHEWPARSPDLTPCDFFLWGWAKEEVYRAKPRTMEQLEDRIRNIITNVPHNFLQKAVDSIPGHLRKLVDAAGAYLEF